MRNKITVIFVRKIFQRNVENRFRAAFSRRVHLSRGPRVGGEHARREFGVGIEF